MPYKSLSTFIILGLSFFFNPSFGKDDNIHFEKKQIRLGKQKLVVEIADDEKKAERGLMFRKSLRENEGMLFIFPNEKRRSFWMKNTFIDLDIGFFSKDQILLEIHSLKASASELTVHPDSCETKEVAKFVLEMGRGWFQKHNIKVGTRFDFIKKQ